MTKSITVLLFFAITLMSFDDSKGDRNDRFKRQKVLSSNFLIGSWEGTLKNKPFKIVIETVNGNKLSGYNLFGENKRKIEGFVVDHSVALLGDGECIDDDDGWIIPVLFKEPGDKKGDGYFQLTFKKCHQSKYARGTYKSYYDDFSGEVELDKK